MKDAPAGNCLDLEYSAVSTCQRQSSRFEGTEATAITVLVIEPRTFYRECIVQAFQLQGGLNIISARSVNEWLDCSKDDTVSLALLCCPDADSSGDRMREDVERLAKSANVRAVVVISDLDGVDSVVATIASGARGFVPAETNVEVVINALKMVNSGGTYVPASSLMAAHKQRVEPCGGQEQISNIFTARQIMVIEALRKGKANKTIAYELNMCESTVKVHVRNIMKRLKAKNRTQVAYLAGKILPASEQSHDLGE